MISTYLIGSHCIMCIVSYGVNLAILFSAWIIRRRFSSLGLVDDTKKDIQYLWQKRTRNLVVVFLFLISVVSTWVFFPAYWDFKAGAFSDRISTGVTAAGHPWLGAESPVLEILEFTDYQCFQCKKMHFFLRQLVADNPEKIRIVHRNYPMDHQFNPIVKDPFHVGSGKMALLAVYAVSKNKFWQMNDLLFGMAGKKKKISLRKLAQKLNLDTNELVRSLNARKIRYHLQKDIFTGNKLGITGTPAYVINGKVYLGSIPAELLKAGIRK
jgi:predicted DsbA family dithiol-disulfide isomerase